MKRQRDDKTATVWCVECNRETKHTLARTYKRTDGNDEIIVWYEFAIIECAGCGSVSFMRTTTCTEDYNSATGRLDSTVRLYPPRDEHTLQARPFENLPEKLRCIYIEILDAFNSGANLLCASGLRALVEGVCSDRKVKRGPVMNKETGKLERKSNLEGKINGLVGCGIVTKQHAAALQKHRFLGNVALHELGTPSRESLKAATQILEHTLENVYELKHTAKRVKVRK